VAQCTGPTQTAYSSLIDRNDGTYELIMRPQESGIHKLQVTYGCEPVPGLSCIHTCSHIVISPLGEVLSIVMIMSVCLSLGLWVNLYARILRNHSAEVHQIITRYL